MTSLCSHVVVSGMICSYVDTHACKFSLTPQNNAYKTILVRADELLLRWFHRKHQQLKMFAHMADGETSPAKLLRLSRTTTWDSDWHSDIQTERVGVSLAHRVCMRFKRTAMLADLYMVGRPCRAAYPW